MGAERKIVQNTVFLGKRHDNKILKVQMLLSKHLVVIAPAPSLVAEISEFHLHELWGLWGCPIFAEVG